MGRSQRGFTLAELMIALAVSALILLGSMEIVRHMVVVSAENRDKTRAVLEVQYVGFWIGEDTVQAQDILMGNTTGFPLVLRWTEWDGDINEVVYSVEGEEVWQLMREQSVNGESYGVAEIGKFLDPDGTTCYRDTLEGEPLDILKLVVTANVDGHEASRTYGIQPRSLPINWGSL